MVQISARGIALARLSLLLSLALAGLLLFAIPRSARTTTLVKNSSVTTAGDLLIDDFESGNSPAPWTFFNGAEFPGARGSLSAGPGFHGKGAHLSYDFTGGGIYVSAIRALSAPVTGEAIAIRLKNPGGCWVRLRVRDSTGQVLQYQFSRPLEAVDENGWYQQIVKLDSPSSHFGGADDGIMHDGIVEVTVMAGSFAEFDHERGVSGAIDFDEVTLIRSLSFDLDPFSSSLKPAPPGSGNLLSDLCVNIHFPVGPSFDIDLPALDVAHDAGFTWVRMDLFWSDIETTPGVYNFSNFDKLLAALEARGMKPLFILDFSNPLHSDCPNCAGSFAYGPQSPLTIKAFGDYAEAAVEHFVGHGVRYEVWNEPNFSLFWKPTPDPSQYANLASQTIARIHAIDPKALVTTGGLSTFDFEFLRQVLSNHGAEGANAVGIHPYRQDGPESATDELVHTKKILTDGSDLLAPIWNTEWGYSSTWLSDSQPAQDGTTTAARNRQATLVLRQVLTTKMLGFPFGNYYDIRDDGADPSDPENNFGLIANDYSDKPAIRALRLLRSMSANRSLVGSLPSQIPGLHALRLAGAIDTLFILWLDQPGSVTAIGLPASASVSDMFGAPITLSGTSNSRTLTLRESDGPVYVVVPEARNAIDDARFFVAQHYADFLNRDPDEGGLNFWTSQITSCGTDQACIDSARIAVSSAFSQSIELDETGYLIERVYKVAYGSANGISTLGNSHTLAVPIVRLNQFLPDAQRLGLGVVVGQAGWETVLETNKAAFASEFVERSDFTRAYPNSLSPAQFVDRLFANARVVSTLADRLAVIAEFNSADDTSDQDARARVLRDVAENPVLKSQESNQAFVLMQYFGYLRRNPNEGLDSDYSGFDFWLSKLNQAGGSFQSAEMIRAFVTSSEYRKRFGP